MSTQDPSGDVIAKPLISVGMPVFNGAATLRQAIESVLSQTLTDLELIISDNASTDATPDICREYAVKDPRIRYVRNAKNVGGANNFNAVLRLSKGRYFDWLPCDDVLLPRFLERCVGALEANPRAVLAFSRASMIDGNSEIIHGYEGATDGRGWPKDVARRYRHFLREITRNYSITIPIYVHGVTRREVLARTHLQRHYLSQDDNLVAEVILQGEVEEVPDTLKLVRYHPGSSGWAPAWSGRMLQQWYRPGQTSFFGRFLMWGWRQRVEYFRIVWAADASFEDKLSMSWENTRAVLRRIKSKLQLAARHLQ